MQTERKYKLHICNIDSDLALADNTPHYIPPEHICRLLRNVAPLPALWADEGDAVLVPSVEEAEAFAARCSLTLPNVRWIEETENGSLPSEVEVQPWGWNRQLRRRLIDMGLEPASLPDEDTLAQLRLLSHRQTAATLLQRMVGGQKMPGIGSTRLCGHATVCCTEDEIRRALGLSPHAYLKMPWSGSGNGIRITAEGYNTLLGSWCRRVLHTQGSVIVEPHYDRILDFSLLYCADGFGTVRYLGLSIFKTSDSGTYIGNLVESEEHKMVILTQYLPESDINLLRDKLEHELATTIAHNYCGTLSVDMMMCRRHGGLALHPCLEINLRNTMGCVALKLKGKVPDGTFITLEGMRKF